MRLFNFHIPPQLDDRMKAEAKRTGLSLSEITRRAMDEYLERKEKRANGGRVLEGHDRKVGKI